MVTAYEFYYQLKPNDLVIKIVPPMYNQCCIVLGHTEIMLNPCRLPFQGPSKLEPHFKVSYHGQQCPLNPHILVKESSNVICKLLPIETQTNSLPIDSNSSATDNSNSLQK